MRIKTPSRDADARELRCRRCQTARHCRRRGTRRGCPCYGVHRRDGGRPQGPPLRHTHQRNKGSGTPANALSSVPHQAGAVAPRRSGLRRPSACGRARLPAFHHGSSQGVYRPLVRSGPGFVDSPSKGRGSLRRRATHFQRCTPHAGHSAGRHDARTAREQS
jgi:hypothetical protein